MVNNLCVAIRKITDSYSSPGRLFASPNITPVRERLIVITTLCAIILGLIAGDARAGDRAKISLGVVEEVILLPWGVRLPARIDTGAATSSLDARELTVVNNVASFKLADKYGGRRLSLPVMRWSKISTSATTSRRPVVAVSLCIGARQIRTEVNLNDRSKVKYPLIIGRNILKQDFIIDSNTAYSTEPSCAEVSSQ